ncbi:carbonyl reductase family member 4 [Dermatophagoides farinae]|uniref:3-ketoacyl-[acyl-carrier-protein] reductase beta subunit n=1 Tax=Dermatophagoides farinae TaxID=6954 RepID=A0A9D4P907_DERFA|nr:carbonyl reductase family member 4-like [Dermatophagoides farinae]KAH7646439.1 carbonyl reductase family member 4-like [Dermatophagoides farinae]
MAPNAIIIGGSRGIGFAIGKKFLENSFNVTLVSKNEENLVKSAATLKKYFHKQNHSNDVCIDYQICDVSNENNVIRTCQTLNEMVNKRNEQIDVLVNSAGITLNKLLFSTKLDDIYNVINTNLISAILITKLLSKQMVRQKNGSIINIGSIVGSHGNIGQTVYSASKAGLIGFTKSFAKELSAKNVRVNMISPGFINTDMTNLSMKAEQIQNYEKIIPLQRIGSAEEVANAVYFLGTSSFITGTIMVVDGGLNLMF